MIYLNFISNLVIAISVAGFIAMLQAPDNPVAKMNPYIRYWIKLSLVFTSAGALLNTISFSNPPYSEVILNLGLAGLFSWSYFWHLKLFNDKKKNLSRLES